MRWDARLGSDVKGTPPVRRTSQKVRILHVVGYLREVGNGIVNSTVDLAALQASRHEVAVAAEGGAFVPLLTQYGVTHLEFDQRRRPRILFDAVGRFRKIVSTFRPDIVHAHMMTGALFARALRLRSGYRLVTTVHNEWQRGALAMGVGDLVTANSAAVAVSLARRGIPKRKLRVVSIGALGGPRRVRSGPVEPAPLEHPAIVTVAGLTHRKGIDVLISAFQALCAHLPAHLYVVGEGLERADFERQVREGPYADRIHLTGFESRPERYMAAADVFVLASRKEPFGMVLSEAREAGCAIVASDVDGIPEALDDGQAGLLFPVGDVPALTSALKMLLEDPSALEAWRERAGHDLARFSAQRYCDEIEAVYRELR